MDGWAGGGVEYLSCSLVLDGKGTVHRKGHIVLLVDGKPMCGECAPLLPYLLWMIPALSFWRVRLCDLGPGVKPGNTHDVHALALHQM